MPKIKVQQILMDRKMFPTSSRFVAVSNGLGLDFKTPKYINAYHYGWDAINLSMILIEECLIALY